MLDYHSLQRILDVSPSFSVSVLFSWVLLYHLPSVLYQKAPPNCFLAILLLPLAPGRGTNPWPVTEAPSLILAPHALSSSADKKRPKRPKEVRTEEGVRMASVWSSKSSMIWGVNIIQQPGPLLLRRHFHFFEF